MTHDQNTETELDAAELDAVAGGSGYLISGGRSEDTGQLGSGGRTGQLGSGG